ncbi:MAG: NAD(P)-binding domain-containing protein, partial [SAR324 cluster bacterium]|nr:NAD(P)-binding domain-containing protein [SAR324 cluster bacterium]
MEKKIQTIGILGGSGALGSGLSYRLGKAGYQVVIGSRNPGKASEKVNEINQRLNQEKISIESNYLA